MAEVSEAHSEQDKDGIYNYDIFSIERKERELLEKYPEHQLKIKKALDLDDKEIRSKKEHEMSIEELRVYRAQLQKDRAEKIYSEKKAERVPNLTFSQQKSIQKKIVTQMGDESENESEVEGDAEANKRGSISSPIITQSSSEQSKQQQQQLKDSGSERLKIFQYLKVLDQSVSIPPRAPGEKDRLTLYMEIDDTLLHTFIYNENFGFMSDPSPKEPDHKIFFGDKRIPINVYLRDHALDFIQFLKDNKSSLEPIVYTSGVPGYTDLLLDILDPKREVFEHRLYQNACYTFEKKDEDIFYMVKDISRFKDSRDMKRSVLLDPNPLNFMLCPDNGLPFVAYTAEMHTVEVSKDEYLVGMTEQLQEMTKVPDVRQYLKENYSVRQILKNAKLL